MCLLMNWIQCLRSLDINGTSQEEDQARKQGCNPITVPKKRPFVKEHYVKRVIDLLNLEDWYEETRSGKAG